jgi:hypothetical protein
VCIRRNPTTHAITITITITIAIAIIITTIIITVTITITSPSPSPSPKHISVPNWGPRAGPSWVQVFWHHVLPA